MNLTHEINPHIFREYDIRAIADEELPNDVCYTIGRSFGSYVSEKKEQKVLVGRDNRITSPRISACIIQGLLESGIDVVDLGLITTPMMYFAKRYYDIPACIMITASHNPKEYNGFKLSFTKEGNAYGPLIEDFKNYTLNGNFQKGIGTSEERNIKQAYFKNIKQSINLGQRKVKVVVDCGNGTGSIVIRDILDMFNVEYKLLYCDSDPSFPNHTADPAVSENMIDLGKKVKEVGADFGIGIDGDADRVGIVDENGKYLTADLVMLIIYRSLAKTMKTKKGLYDVKCSRTLIDGLKKLDIEPIMNRTGAVYCNLRANKEDFDFAGEYSGHLTFRDKYLGFDDGIYAGLRLVEILSNTDKNFSHLLDNIEKYYSTEEIKIKVTDENKFDIVNEIKNYVIDKNYEYEDIDGVRVELKNAWCLIRASNTGPNLTLRFEAKTEKELKRIKKEFESIIDKIIKEKA
ncbi:MAG: phosphomannomutase/phosphoglucomutase [Bacilli bacterium]|nr:phosphomannomutase/phosphoglucomutase [Bacilli bacterium]